MQPLPPSSLSGFDLKQIAAFTLHAFLSHACNHASKSEEGRGGGGGGGGQTIRLHRWTHHCDQAPDELRQDPWAPGDRIASRSAGHVPARSATAETHLPAAGLHWKPYSCWHNPKRSPDSRACCKLQCCRLEEGGLGLLNSRLGPTPSFACASLLAQVWCPM